MSTPKSIYSTKPKTLPKSLGFSRYSLDFDGAEDYVEVPDDASLRMDSSWTISAWIYAEEWTNNLVIVRKALQTDYFFRMETGNQLEVGFYDGTSWQTFVAGNFSVNKWEYVTGVFDDAADAFYIYRNGDLVNSGSVTTSPSPQSKAVGIGAELDGTDFFNGMIDEVLIYSQALSLNEIRKNMLNYHNSTKSGLVGWWRFDEGTGLTAYDKSGNGNDGTLKPSNDPPAWTDVKKWEMRAESGL